MLPSEPMRWAGLTNVTHDKGAGQPSTGITEDNIECARDRQVTLDEVAHVMQIRGSQFTLDQEVKEAVHAWLTVLQKTFFLEGLRKSVQRWTKSV